MKCNQALSAQRAGETEEQTLERAMRDPEVAVRTHISINFITIIRVLDERKAD